QSATEFEDYARLGSATEWAGFAFSHVKVLIDRTGRIARIAREKARIPPSRRKQYVTGYLDDYVNLARRSLRSHRDCDPIAGHLQATLSVPPLLKMLFGAEGRRPPYPEYLQSELQQFPLRLLPMSRTRFLRNTLQILESGSPTSQRT